jgi:hypothetical protein
MLGADNTGRAGKMKSGRLESHQLRQTDYLRPSKALGNGNEQLTLEFNSAWTRATFAFRIDLWDGTGDNIVEHVAGAEDFQIALADAAVVASRNKLQHIHVAF